jgi:hypothetical protein
MKKNCESVDRETENRSVGGSIPPLGTKDFKISQVVNENNLYADPGRNVTGGMLGAQSRSAVWHCGQSVAQQFKSAAARVIAFSEVESPRLN